MKRAISLVLTFALTLSLTMAFASAYNNETAVSNGPTSVAILSDEITTTVQETPMVVGELVNPGDSATYELQIDHALYPEAVLYAFAYGKGTGNSTITLYNEDDSLIGSVTLMNHLDDASSNTVTMPKRYFYIKSSETVIKNYKIVVDTEVGNAGYAINIGTEDTAIEHYGGPINVTTVAKNTTPEAAYDRSVYFSSPQMLLNEGEWFRYTADGYTYITARITNHDSLAFEVYDATGTNIIYSTTPADRGTKTVNASEYQGYVQKGLELENGKDYLIKFYSTSHISATDLSKRYYISIGYPFITSYKLSYTPQTFHVPANTTKTFYIDVSDSEIPASARATGSTAVIFTAGSSLNDAYVSSCRITAPNGYTFSLTGGRYQSFESPSSVNYLGDPNHVPLTGRWKVTVRTSKTSDFRFNFYGYCSVIMGNDGN